jgi:hypothetical protein
MGITVQVFKCIFPFLDMGRYAYFSTGFEYKFAFAIQDSEDIMLFGGVGNFMHEEKEPYHEWEKERDFEYIARQLKKLDIKEVDFEQYTKNTDGTEALWTELCELYKQDFDKKIVAKFILGCLLYHQLMYTETLNVTYEL